MKKLFLSLGVLGILLISPGASAAEINPNIPGTNPTYGSPEGILGNAYQFALLLGGLLAFGAIVYGSILYILGAANPEKKSEGKDRITQALLGLVLLLGAGIILNLVNPQILAKNPQGPSFLIKGLEGIRDTIDPSTTFQEYNKDHEVFEAARKRAAANTQEIHDLETQAAKLRLEGKTSEALKLEKEAANLHTNSATDFFTEKAKLLAKEGAPTEVQKEALNRIYDSRIKEFLDKKDQEAAAAALFERFKANVNFDAEVTANGMEARLKQSAIEMAQAAARAGAGAGAAGAQLPNTTKVASDVNKIMQQISNSAETRARDLDKNDPPKAQAMREAASAAISKIKESCAKKNLTCKDFKP
ncbi:MAG: hypothetical protein FJY98_00915 [Candidatus Liptonbacteria bacterium]|nr:hypothetical protein [Candidatus Liptonbacteria bacterium]